MPNEILIPQNNSRIITQAVYDQDGVGLVLTDVRKVIVTVRALEDDADFLIQLIGLVEYEGTGDTDPGIVAAEIMPEDISDNETPGNYWYDITVIFFGHWFDEGTHDALDFYYEYGKTAEPRDNQNPLWHEVDASHVGLTDDDVNSVEVTEEGTVSANVTGFTVGSIPLYQVTCASGAIVTASTVDKRTVWTRGDRIFTSAKDRFQTIYSITKHTEIEAEE